ncbi:hypothetical protein F2Q70_00001549 [Brassica cretica]|uniref:Uncharacterized protein n=1 Tax=Brassica cretica TaxID=69181 RepID=A0A8S9J4X1_BRACR|nr:hypothetical protein F2Q70_00001549 [Brassica cretica]
MKNAWKIPDKASTLNPPPFTAGEPSLLLPDPPDPLDPALPLSPIQFPPLSSATPTGSKSNSSRKSGAKIPNFPLTAAASLQQVFTTPGALDLEGPAATETVPSGSSNTGSIGSETTTNPATVLDSQSENPNNKFTILQPKFSSPLQTNKASSLPVQKPLETPVTPNPSSNEHPLIAQAADPSQQTAQAASLPSTHPPSLIEKIRASEDKSLKRLAPVSIAASGRPRVLIPDSVFQKGADLHKDFIICYYNGKAPPFNQI